MEHLVWCGKKWQHFFIKPQFGLCVRQYESGRFSNFEVLLSEACEDFCAISVDDSVHIVCQDTKGNIVYLCSLNGSWQRSVLMENKSVRPYPKHFSLVPSGRFLNLFYVISYQEKQMLVHQIIGISDRPPTVVDRISGNMPMFITAQASGTDISVYYKNEAGISGRRVFRWSKKEFSRFMPVCDEKSVVCAVMTESDGHTRYGAFQKVCDVENLVYFEETEDGGLTELVTVNLDAPRDSLPVFWQGKEKLYLFWRESGSIMSSHSTDGGKKWSKPARYMKGTSVSPELYHLHSGWKSQLLYGYEKDREIVFYADADVLDEPITKAEKVFRPAGYEVEEFAQKTLEGESPRESGDAIFLQLKEDFFKLKEQFFALHRRVTELSQRVDMIDGNEKIQSL